MEKHTNVDHNGQESQIVREPTNIQLIASGGQTATVQLVDFSPDSVVLSSPTKLAFKRGQDVQVLMTPSARRFAQVQHAEWVGTDYRITVRWKFAHHRDAARAALLPHDETLPDISNRFHTYLPARFYTFWQLIDAGRLRALADVVDQFERAAKNAGDGLGEKCQELKDAIKKSHSDEFVAKLLDELCTECVAQNVSREPNTSHSIPVMVSDLLSATVERPKKFLGTTAWVLGTVVVLAGHFITII